MGVGRTVTFTISPQAMLGYIAIMKKEMPVFLAHPCVHGHQHLYRVLALHPEICAISLSTVPEDQHD